MIGGLTHKGVLIGWTDTRCFSLLLGEMMSMFQFHQVCMGLTDVDVLVSVGLHEVD